MTTPYTWWTQVPDRLRTKTQLADLDLPRVPGTRPVDAIHTRGPHGRKDTYDLYDATASLPSPASAKHLEAARAHQDPAVRRCAECGAHPDYPPTSHKDTVSGQRMLLCRACLHIARLREAQQHCAASRETIAAQAAGWLAEDRAAVAHVTVITPPPGESGRTRRPVALLVDAATPSGARLVRTTIRLPRSRSPLVPDGAIPDTEAVPALREQLAGRDVVEWTAGSLDPIEDAITAPADADRRPELIVLEPKVTVWRGEYDPHTRHLPTPLDPGRADLMALLIRRMAADHKPAPWDGEAQ